MNLEYFQLHDPIDGEIMGSIIARHTCLTSESMIHDAFKNFMDNEDIYEDYGRNIDGFIDWFGTLKKEVTIERLILEIIYPD